MQTVFVNSRIGTSYIDPEPTDSQRQLIGCATSGELANAVWVPVDGVVQKTFGGGRLGLAHVRVATQVDGLKEMLKWVKEHGTDVNVYLVGGFAKEKTSPVDKVLGVFQGTLYGSASGVNEIYAHIKKDKMVATNATEEGHVPAFLALIGSATSPEYKIGTATIVGCVGVLVASTTLSVFMRKVHLYDCQNNVNQVNNLGNSATLKSVLG